MPIYPEKDIALLQQPDEIITNYDSNDFGVPNDQAQPEVDIATLPGVPGQRGPAGPEGPKGDIGESGVIAATSPILYNLTSKTVSFDQSAQNITNDLRYFKRTNDTIDAGTIA